MMERWKGTTANEQATLQGFVLELCAALGVSAPTPPTDHHRFEYPVQVVDRDGNLANNRIDWYRAGHFALEGKATGQGIQDDRRMRASSATNRPSTSCSSRFPAARRACPPQ